MYEKTYIIKENHIFTDYLNKFFRIFIFVK